MYYTLLGYILAKNDLKYQSFMHYLIIVKK